MKKTMSRAIAACLLLATTVCEAAAPDRCAGLMSFTVPGSTAVIHKAAMVAATSAPAAPAGQPAAAAVPAHCVVEGSIDRRTGSDGKPYAIGFAIALPVDYNGRFLMQGGGGLNGVINPPRGAAAAGNTPALARGFAVVSTDSGHKGAGFDASFLAEQQATLNFLYQANEKVTLVAKQVVTAYYRQPPQRSYFVGCSTGGREAMLMSQRQPDLYDGIVAGAPAMRTNYSNLALRWVKTSLNAAAPKDAEGKSLTSQALSDADRKLLNGALLKACDGLDGAQDGMIFDLRNCPFDPQSLACSGGKTDACLAPVQVTAIARAMAGPKSADGRQVYPGFLYDTGITTGGRGLPGVLVTGFIPEGPAPTGTGMDVAREAEEAHDARSMLGDSNAWTKLGGFSARGGKLIFYHGASDPWFSALETVDYYERLQRDNGGATGVADWSRLFLVPGMGHCAGGDATLDQFDMLDAVVNWVEKGVAPQSVTATGRAFPARSRPLCPYPSHAQYKGTGDVESAQNYSCSP